MGNVNGPTSSDLSRLTGSINELRRSVVALGDSARAMNTNLVAIHELLKEKTDND